MPIFIVNMGTWLILLYVADPEWYEVRYLDAHKHLYYIQITAVNFYFHRLVYISIYDYIHECK